MNVTSEQVIKDIKDGLEGVDPTKVRTIRMIAHPEAEILAQALAPETMVEVFGGCGNIMYTVTTHGPTYGKTVAVKVFYTNPSDAPKPKYAEADAAINQATSKAKAAELLVKLRSLQHDKGEVKSIIDLIDRATPKKDDPQEVIAAKMALVPTIIDKALAIKQNNPTLWAAFMEQMPADMAGEGENFKNILNTIIENCHKLLILIE